MPPRKGPQETVQYPASKRKAPPFKPQRPSQVPRVHTTESKSSANTTKTNSTTAKPTNAALRKGPAKAGSIRRGSNIPKKKPGQATKKAVIAESTDGEDDEEGDDDAVMGEPTRAGASESSEDGLEDNPLATKRPKPPPKRRQPAREPSPMSISSNDDADASRLPQDPLATTAEAPPIPSQSDTIPSIPQPLLIRLMYEHFVDKETKIDKQAIQVLQKYFEVFVREAIARAALQKREDAENGTASQSEVGWLDLEDLEKIAGAMMLDF